MKQDQLYDLSVIKELIGENHDDMIDFINLFLTHTPIYLNDLIEFSSKHDYEGLRRLAHKLKSSIRLLKITSIEKEIVLLEVYAKGKQNLDEIPQLVDKINTVLLQVFRDLKGG